jgi:rRNA-processing protein FCF1
LASQKLVVLDTNFLLALMQKKIDFAPLIREFFDFPVRLVVLKPCLNELKALKEGKRAFPAISEYLRANSVDEIVTSAQSADKAILDFARERGAVVATLDYVLRQRLKKAGVQSITLKNKTIVSP